MTPTNFLILESTNSTPYHFKDEPQLDAREGGILRLAAAMAEDHWVYFGQRNHSGIHDSEEGVRFLNLDGHLIQCFGHLEAVLVIDDRRLFERVKRDRPETPAFFWGRGSENGLASAEIFEADGRAPALSGLVERLVFSSRTGNAMALPEPHAA